MKHFAGVVLLFLPTLGFGQEAQSPNPVLLTAKSAQLLVEVVGTKTQKPSFNAEIARIFRLVNQTKLWANYRYMNGPNADIIIKILEDQTLVADESISLTVFNPDNNEKVYSETRNLVDISNDVPRLVSHFLDSVVNQKEQVKQAQREEERQARLRGEVLVKITCPSAEMYANRAAERTVRRVLHKGDLVAVTMNAGDEYVVKVGKDTGYVNGECLDTSVLPEESSAESVDSRVGLGEKASTPHTDIKNPIENGLYVRSRPEGAAVFINGAKQSGRTPLSLSLTPGKYNLVVRLTGYAPYSGTVEIKGDVPTQLQIELKQNSKD